MIQEEKAKAYDEAKARMSKAYNDNRCTIDFMNEIFPELKGSNDERIELLNYLYDVHDDDEERARWIAWLEKQGDQKPIDKVEPKFNVNDWVIDSQGIVHQIGNVIENVTNHTYGYDIVGSGYFNDNTEGVRLWTIQDAKDGDVLANNGNIILFKQISDSARPDYKFIQSYCFVLTHRFDFYLSGTYNLDDGFHPATKEQRDLLFQKMTDAGYTFDFEKKELRKIEQKSSTSVTEFDIEVERFCKECFITDTNEKGNVFCIARHFADWQKNRQKPVAWSGEVSAFKDKLLELFQKFRWKGTPTNGEILEYVDAHIQELIGTIQKPA